MDNDKILTVKDVRNHLRQNTTYKLAKMHVKDVLKAIFVLPWVFLFGTLIGLASSPTTSNYKSSKDQSNNKEPRRRRREKLTVTIRKKGFFEDTFW